MEKYDPTAGMVETPAGVGRYLNFDANTGKVLVEMNYEDLVEFDGSECYPVLDSKEV